MNDQISTIEIKNINLDSAQIGQNINERFEQIQSNFEKIVSSEYLKGAKGDSIIMKTIKLGDDKELLDNFTNLILGEQDHQGNDNVVKAQEVQDLESRIQQVLTDKTVTLIYNSIEKNNKIEYTLQSSIPFIYKHDWEYNKNDTVNINLDYSCIICYDSNIGGWTKLSAFPTIYYDDSLGEFCWKINGVETGLIAAGPAGAEGKQGTGIIITAHTIVDGSNTIQYVFHNIDEDTINNETPSDENKNKWVSIDDTSKPLDNINDGSLVFSIEITGGQNPNEIDLTDPQTQGSWIWGLLKRTNETSHYETAKILSGGKLSHIFNFNDKSLLDLMKMNEIIFIPSNSKTINNEPQGHILYNKNASELKLGWGKLDSDSKPILNNTTGTLQSYYSNNIFDGDIEVKGQIKGISDSANKLNLGNIGSAEKPVYFKDGVPVICNNTLDVSISGNASTATEADKAKTAESANKLNSGNIGDASHPVYFNNGIPVACDAYAYQYAEKLYNTTDNSTINIGSASKPVYFANGVPVVCTGPLNINISGNANTATTADKANKLNLGNIGSAEKPVYFKNGVPEVITAFNGRSSIATKLSPTGNTTGYNIGSAEKPVYFKDGVPEVINTFNGRSSIATKLSPTNDTIGYNIGSAEKPIYFKNGIPVVCDGPLNINISGNATTADKANKSIRLETARKIKATKGITGISEGFDGSKDIQFNIDKLNESYLTWGDKDSSAGYINPIDIALNGELSANRLSFMPAEDIQIDYTNDGGNNWSDYGLLGEEKQSLVTTGLKQTIYLGKKNTKQSIQDQTRVTITATAGKTYFSLRKILTYINTGGATDCKVKIETLAVGATDVKENWVETGIYNVAGRSGWNALPLNVNFGSYNDSQTTNVRKVRLTYFFKSYALGYGESANQNPVVFGVYKISMHGENSWQNSGGPLAATGCMYEYDIAKNIIFSDESNIVVQGGLNANSLESNTLTSNKIKSDSICPESIKNSLGTKDNKWAEGYIDKLNSINVVSSSANIEVANIQSANIKNAKISDLDLGNVVIRDKLPTGFVRYENEMACTVQNTPNSILYGTLSNGYQGQDPGSGSGVMVDVGGFNIKLSTSKLPDLDQDKLSMIIPYLCIPIGISYINGRDWHGGFKRYYSYADVYLTQVKVKLVISGTTYTYSLPDQCAVKYKNSGDSEKRNVTIFYPTLTNISLQNIKLTKSGNKYNDLDINIQIEYTIKRSSGSDYDDTILGRNYIYGVELVKSPTLSTYSAELVKGTKDDNYFKNLMDSKLYNEKNRSIQVIYYSALDSQRKVYIAQDGIKIINGLSHLLISPPKDNSTGNQTTNKDDYGYIEVYRYNAKDMTKSETLKKSLYDLLK